MPRLHGVEAVEQIRRKHPNVCLIAVTGDSDQSLHRAATDAGADGVLVKGEIIAALVDRITTGRT
jgi:DNA-binding NarL/FixJ family response regulator